MTGVDPRGQRPSDLKLEHFGLAEIRRDVLGELEELYARAYHNSRMYPRLIEDIQGAPEVFRLFVMRDAAAGGGIVGARVIESLHHPIVNYLGFPPIHGKRFSVSPDRRGQGIGSRIHAASMGFVFDELKLPAVFGESHEIGALAFHARKGALFLADTIPGHFSRNTAEQSLALLAEFMENPRLRELRLPSGHGVQFVHCREEEVVRTFREHGYVTNNELQQAAERLAEARLRPKTA